MLIFSGNCSVVEKPNQQNDRDVSSVTTESSNSSEISNNKSTKQKEKKRKRSNSNERKNDMTRLIDDKRRHMERQLSASQRDQMLVNKPKEDGQFKKDIAEAIYTSRMKLLPIICNRFHSL